MTGVSRGVGSGELGAQVLERPVLQGFDRPGRSPGERGDGLDRVVFDEAEVDDLALIVRQAAQRVLGMV